MTPVGARHGAVTACLGPGPQRVRPRTRGGHLLRCRDGLHPATRAGRRPGAGRVGSSPGRGFRRPASRRLLAVRPGSGGRGRVAVGQPGGRRREGRRLSGRRHLVWVVDPVALVVRVHRSPQDVELVQHTGELPDGDVRPGSAARSGGCFPGTTRRGDLGPRFLLRPAGSASPQAPDSVLAFGRRPGPRGDRPQSSIQVGRLGGLDHHAARSDHAPTHSRSRKSVKGRIPTPSRRRHVLLGRYVAQVPR